MINAKQKLTIEQLDRRFGEIHSLSNSLSPPSEGWIKTLRKTLNISLKRLGKRLNVSSQNINQYEQREKDGSISIQKLKEVAEAMNMDFRYIFITREGSLEKMIEKQAKKIAKEIVMRTSQTMKLEDQENSRERLKRLLKIEQKKLKTSCRNIYGIRS